MFLYKVGDNIVKTECSPIQYYCRKYYLCWWLSSVLVETVTGGAVCGAVVLNCFMLKAAPIILLSWHSGHKNCNLTVAYVAGLLFWIAWRRFHDFAFAHPVSCMYRNITFSPRCCTLPQEPRCVQLANLQWHAGPVQARWHTAPPSEEDCLPPGLQPDDLWLWHCTAGAQRAAGVHQHYPTHLPTLFLPRLPCRHVVLGHRLGRPPRRR